MGGSSLARKQKSSLFSKRNGLIAAGLAALVGVVAVAFSFASTTPNNQYSLYDVCSTSKAGATAPDPKVQTCINNSAETMAYRLYRGATGQDPEPTKYSAMVQQLAGDRLRTSTVAGEVVNMNATSGDEQFIKSVYANMLGRPADATGLKYWKAKMAKDKKLWDRSHVLAQFATTNGAKKHNQAIFSAYSVRAPRVAVRQTAAIAQAARLVRLQAHAKTAAAAAATATAQDKIAKQALASATKTAGKSSPTMEDLQSIDANRKAATAAKGKAQAASTTAARARADAKVGYSKARAVAAYSPDIASNPKYGIKLFKVGYDTTVKAQSSTASAAKSAASSESAIRKAYTAAETKYNNVQIAQEKKAEEAAARQGGGTDTSTGAGSTGGTDTSTGGGSGGSTAGSGGLTGAVVTATLSKEIAPKSAGTCAYVKGSYYTTNHKDGLKYTCRLKVRDNGSNFHYEYNHMKGFRCPGFAEAAGFGPWNYCKVKQPSPFF